MNPRAMHRTHRNRFRDRGPFVFGVALAVAALCASFGSGCSATSAREAVSVRHSEPSRAFHVVRDVVPGPRQGRLGLFGRREAGAESLLPAVREELGDALGGVRLNADHDVREIDLGIHAVAFARCDEGIERH